MKIALLCGGPSLERGISLNSARSVMDHLESKDLEIIPFYFDFKKRPYKISRSQLYSNTPSDFDFKLAQTAIALSPSELIKELKKCDIAFPAIHGQFGEDGQIQTLLEKNKIPYVGSSAKACKLCFDKYNANEHIKKLGFFTLPSVILKIYQDDENREIVEKFFKENVIKRAVVKPASGGSSIGVFSVSTAKEAIEKAEMLFSKRMDTRIVVEQFAEAKEFTVVILQNKFGLPVALVPSEIETDYAEHQIFSFRKKYLPTRQVTYHCPPRFDNQMIEKIQVQAEQLFSAFGMTDFARFDGWVFPDGKLWFADFNPISGMEQNSFLFQQSSRVGLTHQTVLQYIVKHASQRNGLIFPKIERDKFADRKEVNVLFGGQTSERQVSLMSGTNVWLKLRKSTKYEPKPFLLDTEGNVWQLPYTFTLNHTVEEIAENCGKASADEERLQFFEKKAQVRLSIGEEIESEPFFLPKKISLETLIKNSKFIFNALHGGMGENGMLQGMLDKARVKYNGSNQKVSELCMDKFQTGEFLEKSKIKGITSAKKKLIDSSKLKDSQSIRELWRQTVEAFGANALIIKPNADGCSSGVVKLNSARDLEKYLELIRLHLPAVPKNTFKGQEEIVELPNRDVKQFLLEEFIETDSISVVGNKLVHNIKKGWIEITIGVIEENNKIRALNPSLTVAEGTLLTVEEKFQGGTGINITPPPESIISETDTREIREKIRLFAGKIGIEGYARVDAFVNTKTLEIIIIEVNTLPGLTPSTVLYHQGLAENPPVYPRELLEKLIENKGY